MPAFVVLVAGCLLFECLATFVERVRCRHALRPASSSLLHFISLQLILCVHLNVAMNLSGCSSEASHRSAASFFSPDLGARHLVAAYDGREGIVSAGLSSRPDQREWVPMAAFNSAALLTRRN
jgi:hypothetical protein